MRVAIAQLNFKVADITGNAKKIAAVIERAKEQQADLVVFSELALTGYPPDDFLLLPHFLDAVEEALKQLATLCYSIVAIVGTPRRNNERTGKPLFNSGAVLAKGAIVGYVDKRLLPTYDVFDEHRYFEPGRSADNADDADGGRGRSADNADGGRGRSADNADKVGKSVDGSAVVIIANKRVAITICEDIWKTAPFAPLNYSQKSPLELLAKKSLPIDLLINLSASPFSIDNPKRRFAAAQQAVEQVQAPLVLCNQVGANDNLIFDGTSFAMNAAGGVLKYAKSFAEDMPVIDLEAQPLSTEVCKLAEQDEAAVLWQALVLGVRDYFCKQGFHSACLGLSGGIDSAVVAAIAVEALGRENVIGLLMPSRYSSEGSIVDALQLADNLGMAPHTLSIEEPFKEVLQLLSPHFATKAPDATEENIQARLRGLLMMAFSNKFGHILLSTGNKSEMAVGYCTLYGDLCGGLAVINDLTKRRVYAIARYLNREHEVIPQAIIDKEPSAELRPNQKDSDSLPPYELLDQVVEGYLERYLTPEQIAEHCQVEPELVDCLVKAIHRNEYKRRQAPMGLRVTDKAFSSGRRFPIVQGWL